MALRRRHAERQPGLVSDSHLVGPGAGAKDEPIFVALSAVLDRYETFNRLGALAGEGGERAFRGWLLGGFLQPTLGWDWRKVVLGESLDVLALDWRDHPVVYIETKTPDSPLKLQHRAEMIGRAPKWGSLRHLFLTNGRAWERFDIEGPTAIDISKPDASYLLSGGASGCAAFFGALDARRYVP
jgi:hypothetical protein